MQRLWLSFLSVVALSTTATDTVFSILRAVSLSTARASFFALPIVASTLGIVTLICVGLFSAQYIWKREGIVQRSTRTSRVLAACCILPAMVTLILSLTTIITIKTRSNEVDLSRSEAAVHRWTNLLTAQIPIWVLACLSQMLLYTSSLVGSVPKGKTQSSVSVSGSRDSVMSEARSSNQTTNLYMPDPTELNPPLVALASPVPSGRLSQSPKLWRDSLQHVVRPMTSRAKLISRPSTNRESRGMYSDGRSIDSLSQVDAFEAWDTSDVDGYARETAAPSAKDCSLQSAPSRGTVLEPIPGSRSPSPARALDGPFPLASDGRESPALTPPPKMLPDLSRPPSPVVSEAHIHPLFRTESPTPAPPTTPGTSVIASPLATQMIPCPPLPYSRMRSNSNRAASPSPLLHSQSTSNLRNPASSIRSPSPPSREMTPPIPDLILNSSPQNSRRQLCLS